MLRLARIRTLILPLAIVLALAGALVWTMRARPRPSVPAAPVAPSPIDAHVPPTLSTATFGLG
ncbi:MAG: hypothetical protein ACYC77_09625 [Coriobacteriia bacterium]